MGGAVRQMFVAFVLLLIAILCYLFDYLFVPPTLNSKRFDSPSRGVSVTYMFTRDEHIHAPAPLPLVDLVWLAEFKLTPSSASFSSPQSHSRVLRITPRPLGEYQRSSKHPDCTLQCRISDCTVNCMECATHSEP